MPHHPLIGRIIRSALFEDWALKFICLILAVLMWFYIDGELTDQRDLTVALRPADLELPEGYEVAPDCGLPKYNVRVRGTRRRLQLMGPESISFKRKKLDAPQPGRNRLNLQPADLEADGCSILAVSPKDNDSSVELLVSSKQLKLVRIKPRGEPKDGYLIGESSTEPNKVNVVGTNKDLAQVNFVWTEPVDVSEADQDVVREVGIEPFVEVDGKRVPIRCNEKVRATVSIHAVQVTRTQRLEVRPLTLPGTAMSVEPKSVAVEVVAEGDAFALAEKNHSIILYVEWPSAWDKPADATTHLGPVRAQVRVVAPSGVEVRGVNNTALPTVEVRGGWCGALSSESSETPK